MVVELPVLVEVTPFVSIVVIEMEMGGVPDFSREREDPELKPSLSNGESNVGC